MIAAASLATVFGYWFVGTVLFRALVLRLCALDEAAGQPAPSERDLLLRSALPAFAIVGTIGTALALLRLFRGDVTLGVGAALLVWRRRDAACVAVALAALATDLWRAIRRGNLVASVAVAAFGALGYILILLSHMPSANVDAWVFQLPLAQSMIAHRGFVYPQIGDLFYANNPLFFNVLFAQVLLFVDHFIAANAMNVAIYLGFLLCLASLAPRARTFGLLVVLYLVATCLLISTGATLPLTDVPRACYSVLALLFAHRYLHGSRVDEIATAGLLAGAAVAGKYTELVTLALIGATLLPRLLTQTRVWRDTAIFGGAVLLVAGFWYAKNWISLGNPIYPFVFAHPGLSDEWLADYMRQMRQAFDPADRIYVTNLLTLSGWHDFGFILYHWFLDRLPAQIAAALILAAIVARPARIAVPVWWTAALFVTWYAVMFNSIRWAMPAYLLFLSTAYLAWSALFEIFVARMSTGASARAMSRWEEMGRRILAPWGHGRRPAVIVSAIAMAVAMLATWAAGHASGYPPLRFIANALENDLIRVAMGRSTVDEYLAKRREGYMLYRYIGEHDLRVVLQPFDSGAVIYESAYNGGRHENRFLPYQILPSEGQSIDQFLSEHHVHYFIYRPSLPPAEIDHLGHSHADRGNLVVAALLPRSHLLLADGFGWSLYAIDQ
jgi:hypothetical protein